MLAPPGDLAPPPRGNPGSTTEFFEIPQLMYPSSFTIDLNKIRGGKVEFIYIIGTISWPGLELFSTSGK